MIHAMQAGIVGGAGGEVTVCLCRDCRGDFCGTPTSPNSRSQLEVGTACDGGMDCISHSCQRNGRPLIAVSCLAVTDMGIARLQMDRCYPCALLWLDTDELRNRVLAIAKTNHCAEQSWVAARESLDLHAMTLPAAAVLQAAVPELTRSRLFRRPQTGEALTAVPSLLRLQLR